MANVGSYKNKINRRNISAITGKKAHEDAALIVDIQTALNTIVTPYLNDMEMADAIRWLIGWDSYVKDKNGYKGFKYSTHSFKRGEILLVNLWGHMGVELTYPHPAIVIDSGFNWLLVAPISTPAYGDSDKYHIDLVPSDGVEHNCAVKLDHMRSISKNRVIGVLGKISSNAKLNQIDEVIIKYFCPKTHEKYEQKASELEYLKDKMEIKDDEILKQSAEIARLNQEIERLSSLVSETG